MTDTTTLTGPTGGRWVRTRSEQRVVYRRCSLCSAQITEGWAYFVGITEYATACLECADAIVNTETEEVNVTGTAGITPDMLVEVALALEAANLDWEQGRATSPDTRDFVLITERIVADRIGPEYLWLADGMTQEMVAEALYEAQSDGQLNEWPEMAEWLVTAVTTGQDLGQPGGDA
jgi:hypothetical protein